MELVITRGAAEGCTLVAARGEVDIYTAPILSEEIAGLIQGGAYDLVIDLREVDFLDSTGLGVLVASLKNVHGHGGSLQLVCNQERLLKLFRMTGLMEVFGVHKDCEAALAGSARVAGPGSARVG